MAGLAAAAPSTSEAAASKNAVLVNIVKSPLSDGPLLRSGGDGTAIRKPNAGPASCFPAELSQHDMSQP
jgi:hypothetical protein